MLFVEVYFLGVCFFIIVLISDLVFVDIVYLYFGEEFYEVFLVIRYRWYFRLGMMDKDIVFFKIFDNKIGDFIVFCKL